MKTLLKAKLKNLIKEEIENDVLTEKISEKIINDGWVKINFEIGKTYYFKRQNSEVIPVTVDKIEFLVDKIRIRARYFVKEIIYFDNEDYGEKVFSNIEDIKISSRKGKEKEEKNKTEYCKEIIYSDGQW